MYFQNFIFLLLLLTNVLTCAYHTYLYLDSHEQFCSFSCASSHRENQATKLKDQRSIAHFNFPFCVEHFCIQFHELAKSYHQNIWLLPWSLDFKKDTFLWVNFHHWPRISACMWKELEFLLGCKLGSANSYFVYIPFVFLNQYIAVGSYRFQLRILIPLPPRKSS